MARDAIKIKEDIIDFLKRNGPSLPAQAARRVQQSILFTSAFLSELFSEKRVKISNMKIGNSPLYFLNGQEEMLEKFSQELKGKEKEAFLILKEKKFLRDSELEPAIRVALREIRDFAIPFKNSDEIFWRYFNAPESEFVKESIKVETEKTEKPILTEKVISTDDAKKELKIKPLVEEEKIKIREQPIQMQAARKKIKQKSRTPKTRKDESFFNKVKENLSLKNIEILDILDFSKNHISLKVKKDGAEKIIFAFNKKKLSEKDIIKASKKASERGLIYEIMLAGRIPKKFDEFVKAIKGLSSVEALSGEL